MLVVMHAAARSLCPEHDAVSLLSCCHMHASARCLGPDAVSLAVSVMISF